MGALQRDGAVGSSAGSSPAGRRFDLPGVVRTTKTGSGSRLRLSAPGFAKATPDKPAGRPAVRDETMADDLKEAIKQNAGGPKQANADGLSGDGGGSRRWRRGVGMAAGSANGGGGRGAGRTTPAEGRACSGGGRRCSTGRAPAASRGDRPTAYGAARALPATQLADSQGPGARNQGPLRNRPQVLLPYAQEALARPRRKPCTRGGMRPPRRQNLVKRTRNSEAVAQARFAGRRRRTRGLSGAGGRL